jgi:copper(I)-binding protein
MHTLIRALARAIAIVSLVVLVPVASAHEFKGGTLEIGHPWSRATLPGAKVAAGYLTVKNSGTEEDRLLSASSEIAGKTEIHEMNVDAQGIMTMRPLAEPLVIPAGGEVKLAPKGLHVMFMDLTSQPKEGETFSATLTFEKAGAIDVEFNVDKAGGDHDQHGG